MRKKAKHNLFFALVSLGLFLNITGFFSALDQQKEMIGQVDALGSDMAVMKFQVIFLKLNRIREDFLMSGDEKLVDRERELGQEISYCIEMLGKTFPGKQDDALVPRLTNLFNIYERRYLNAVSSLTRKDLKTFRRTLPELLSSADSIINLTENSLNNRNKDQISGFPWTVYNLSGIAVLFISLFFYPRKSGDSEDGPLLPDRENLAAMSAFMAGLAHEIKNPLAGIQANLELLAMEQGQSEELRLAVKECKRLYRLLDGYVDVLRPSRWKCEKAELVEIAGEIRSLLASEIREKKIMISEEFSVERVEVDPDRFKQLWINLLQNAIKASPDQGQIIVRAALQKNTLVFSIEDQGPGVSSEHEKMVFYPFFTLDKKGTGLGLFICSAIVRSAGGRLCYRRRTGRTVFEVMLPCCGS